MSYIPQQGDIIWLDFDPQKSHEPTKRRPALVLSPAEYNAKTSLCILCPMTSKIKGYPFEVHEGTRSVILADHVKNLDWHARHATFKKRASPEVLRNVLSKLSLLLNIPH